MKNRSLLKDKKNLHFVGIGGIGMSGIARILLDMDYNVSGSDVVLSGTAGASTANTCANTIALRSATNQWKARCLRQ